MSSLPTPVTPAQVVEHPEDAPPAPKKAKKAQEPVSRDYMVTIFECVERGFRLTDGRLNWVGEMTRFFDVPALRVVYLVGQLETCPTTSKRHVQAFCRFRSPVSLATAKRRFTDAGFPSGVHFESRRGTLDQAIGYCKKEDTRVTGTEPHEWGMEAVLSYSLPDVFNIVEYESLYE